MTDTPPLPPERFSNTLEELRASVAADQPQGRLAAKLQRAILRLLEALLALLASLKEGTLTVAAPAAADPTRAASASPDGANPAFPQAKQTSAPGARPLLTNSPAGRRGNNDPEREAVARQACAATQAPGPDADNTGAAGARPPARPANGAPVLRRPPPSISPSCRRPSGRRIRLAEIVAICVQKTDVPALWPLHVQFVTIS